MNNEFPMYLSEIPFFIGNLDSPENAEGLPNRMDMTVNIDKETGRIFQESNDDIENILEQAYCIGSEITGYMDSFGIGKNYAEDFFRFTLSRDVGEALLGSVLEIGCGSGYLLSLYKMRGASVLGIEPNRRSITSDHSVEIINGFFPMENSTGNYDVIIAYCVLEHIAELNDFLESIKLALRVNGHVFFAVPDCYENINNGDISMFIHEHMSYFTEESFTRTMGKVFANYKVHTEKSRYGNLIYAHIYLDGTPIVSKSALPMDQGNYPLRAAKSINRIKSLLMKYNDIGVYVPGRFINYFSVIHSVVPINGVRFFDDNELLRGKYFPGIDIPIESFEDYSLNPAKVVLIMSFAFSEVIASKVRASNPTAIILTLRDVLHE